MGEFWEWKNVENALNFANDFSVISFTIELAKFTVYRKFKQYQVLDWESGGYWISYVLRVINVHLPWLNCSDWKYKNVMTCWMKL